jgi:hypothetical protein
MADSYYYQVNGETLGPLSPSGLKQLANEGVIGASTPVRKGEQGAWYQAGTIAGLVPPKPAEAAAPTSFEADAGERARRTFEKAGEQAEKVAQELWFLDLKFTRFFTPKLVGALWAIFLCLVVFIFLGSTVYYLFTYNALYALAAILFQLLGLSFTVLWIRILLEVFLVMFRIAEQLESLKNLEYLKHLADQQPR